MSESVILLHGLWMRGFTLTMLRLRLEREGYKVELLDYASPGTTGSAERRPMNQLGLTHLSLRVDDVGAVAATIESLGGTVVRSTRTTLDFDGTSLDFLYCTDPDGVRIELMDLGG